MYASYQFYWIPAFAGMTQVGSQVFQRFQVESSEIYQKQDYFICHAELVSAS